MAEETQKVEMTSATLEFCRDALIRQIEATYDEPAICDLGVAHELAFLRSCAHDLGVDFDKVVQESVPVWARQRLEKALAVEGSVGDRAGQRGTC
jgi:hypothetical protein